MKDQGATIKQKAFTLGFLGIISIGIVLRLISLNQSLWLDEAISAKVVKIYSYADIVTKFAPSDFHPPLYYLVLKAWTSIAGLSELGLRSLSVFIAVVTIYGVYKIGLLVANKRTGLFAALLLATAPLHVYYSQEARMYALETLLVVVSFYCFVRLSDNAERNDKGVKTWIVFTLVNALLIYTDYLPSLIFVVYLVCAKRFFSKLVISLVCSLVCFMPFVPIFWQQLHLGQQASATAWSTVLGKISLKALALVWVKFLIGRISFDNKVVYGLFVVIPTSVILTVVAYHLKRVKGLTLNAAWVTVGLWLVIPLGLGVVLALKLAVFDYFRFLFVLPALYLLVAYGLDALPARIFSRTLIVIFVLFNLVATGIYLFNPKHHREDWRGAVAYIEHHSNHDAAVGFVNIAQADAYRYYSKGEVPAYGPADSSDEVYEKIWLMRYVQDIFDPQDELRKNIERAGFHKVAEHDFNRVIFWEYHYAE